MPAWDFVRDGWVHSRIAVVRGVEGDYAVARGADDGLLIPSDARGRVLGERASSGSAGVLLAGLVPEARAERCTAWAATGSPG